MQTGIYQIGGMANNVNMQNVMQEKNKWVFSKG